MNPFKKHFITELSISLLIIIALLAGIFFFRGNVSDYTDKIVSSRTLLVSRTDAVNQLASLHGEYNNASKYLNVLHNIIPSYDQLINLNKDIQSLAAQNKLDYSFSFAGETPKPDGGLGSISFNLTVSSPNFNALAAFIKALQNFKYLSSVDNVSMKSNDALLTFAIKGRVFYR